MKTRMALSRVSCCKSSVGHLEQSHWEVSVEARERERQRRRERVTLSTQARAGKVNRVWFVRSGLL